MVIAGERMGNRGGGRRQGCVLATTERLEAGCDCPQPRWSVPK